MMPSRKLNAATYATILIGLVQGIAYIAIAFGFEPTQAHQVANVVTAAITGLFGLNIAAIAHEDAAAKSAGTAPVSPATLDDLKTHVEDTAKATLDNVQNQLKDLANQQANNVTKIGTDLVTNVSGSLADLITKEMAKLHTTAKCLAIILLPTFLFFGCAQDTKQPTKIDQVNKVAQSTEGAETPQTTTINVHVDGQAASGGSTITTTQPAGRMRGAATQPSLASAKPDLLADASNGSGAGLNIVIAPIYIEHHGLQKTDSGDVSPRTGAQSPRTGAISPTATSTQKPQADLSIPLSVAAGMNPTADAQSTQATRGGQVSGSPQSSNQSGARNVTQLKAASDGLAQLLGILKGQTQLTPELSAASDQISAQKSAIDAVLVGLLGPGSQPGQ